MKLRYLVRNFTTRFELVPPGVNPLENADRDQERKVSGRSILWPLIMLWIAGMLCWGAVRLKNKPDKADAAGAAEADQVQASATLTASWTATLLPTSTQPIALSNPPLLPTIVTPTLRYTPTTGPPTPTMPQPPTSQPTVKPAPASNGSSSSGGAPAVKQTKTKTIQQSGGGDLYDSYMATGDAIAAQQTDAASYPSETPTLEPTITPWIIIITATPGETPTPIPTEAPTETPTEIPSETPTITPTEIPSETPTITPTVTETWTATPTITVTITLTPTIEVIPLLTITMPITATPTLTPTLGGL